jgi:hypothetical protein
MGGAEGAILATAGRTQARRFTTEDLGAEVVPLGLAYGHQIVDPAGVRSKNIRSRSQISVSRSGSTKSGSLPCSHRRNGPRIPDQRLPCPNERGLRRWRKPPRPGNVARHRVPSTRRLGRRVPAPGQGCSAQPDERSLTRGQVPLPCWWRFSSARVSASWMPRTIC